MFAMVSARNPDSSAAVTMDGLPIEMARTAMRTKVRIAFLSFISFSPYDRE